MFYYKLKCLILVCVWCIQSDCSTIVFGCLTGSVKALTALTWVWYLTSACEMVMWSPSRTGGFPMCTQVSSNMKITQTQTLVPIFLCFLFSLNFTSIVISCNLTYLLCGCSNQIYYYSIHRTSQTLDTEVYNSSYRNPDATCHTQNTGKL